MKIGEVITKQGDIILNEGRKTLQLTVANVGDRPIQVGSHFHFFEVNRLLKFDRMAAFGYRLDIPSGNSVRFEPGEEREVNLVEIGGRKCIYGLNDLTRAVVSEETKAAACLEASKKGFL